MNIKKIATLIIVSAIALVMATPTSATAATTVTVTASNQTKIKVLNNKLKNHHNEKNTFYPSSWRLRGRRLGGESS